jgi:hypothetical protein
MMKFIFVHRVNIQQFSIVETNWQSKKELVYITDRQIQVKPITLLKLYAYCTLRVTKGERYGRRNNNGIETVTAVGGINKRNGHKQAIITENR